MTDYVITAKRLSQTPYEGNYVELTACSETVMERTSFSVQLYPKYHDVRTAISERVDYWLGGVRKKPFRQELKDEMLAAYMAMLLTEGST